MHILANLFNFLIRLDIKLIRLLVISKNVDNLFTVKFNGFKEN